MENIFELPVNVVNMVSNSDLCSNDESLIYCNLAIISMYDYFMNHTTDSIIDYIVRKINDVINSHDYDLFDEKVRKFLTDISDDSNLPDHLSCIVLLLIAHYIIPENYNDMMPYKKSSINDIHGYFYGIYEIIDNYMIMLSNYHDYCEMNGFELELLLPIIIDTIDHPFHWATTISNEEHDFDIRIYKNMFNRTYDYKKYIQMNEDRYIPNLIFDALELMEYDTINERFILALIVFHVFISDRIIEYIR